MVCRIAAGLMKRRNLSQQDLLAASKTYVPTGKRDEFIAFSSGGQSGQIIVYGIPSMRILKYIGVFTPEPWQGYGFDEESKAVLRQGNIDGKEINWGDTHHPAMSETQGKKKRRQHREKPEAQEMIQGSKYNERKKHKQKDEQKADKTPKCRAQ
eukprot:TRINITY_DN416_c0_g1_i9.p2 TRINITY_DN416_c0_g1~~TRINITY_DN416_c0_g1_i9.p2  ORF type:complete len:154 (+),score=14.04 TRINITY_DN416_c0_g1_i9:369-830(+)